MKPAWNHPGSSRNELKTLEIGLGGRNRLDFGTVRPRVQIPGPRPFLYSKSAILDVFRSRRVTDGAQIRGEPRNEAAKFVAVVGRSELGRQGLVRAHSYISVDATVRTVRHPVRKSQAAAPKDARARPRRTWSKIPGSVGTTVTSNPWSDSCRP